MATLSEENGFGRERQAGRPGDRIIKQCHFHENKGWNNPN
jgi:hypothetical protein